MPWEIRRRQRGGSSGSNRRGLARNRYNRLFQPIESTSEKVVGGHDKLKALRLGEPFERSFEFFLRAVLVDCALHEVLRNPAGGKIFEPLAPGGKSSRDQARRAGRAFRQGTTQLHGDPRAEGESRYRVREIGIALPQK